MRRLAVIVGVSVLAITIAGVANATLTTDLVTIWTTRYTSATTAATAIAAAIEGYVTGYVGAYVLAGDVDGDVDSNDLDEAAVESEIEGVLDLADLQGSLDHGSKLSGLTDDDHTQYALLAGRAGGQTLSGGSASGEDITIKGSSHATNGHAHILGGEGHEIEVSDAGTNTSHGLTMRRRTSGSMADGFGPELTATAIDTDAVENTLGSIEWRRSGGDNTANVGFNVAFAGALSEEMTLTPGGLTLQDDLSITNGGTGQSTATAAFDALAPTTTQGDIIYHNGTDNVRLAKGAAHQALTMNNGATAPRWGPTIGVLESDVTCAVSASYCTIWSITPGASRGVMINAQIVIDADSTAVAPQFRVSSADSGYTGFCSWELFTNSTGTTGAPGYFHVSIGTAPADTAGTTWPDTDPRLVRVACALVSDASPGAILIELQLETGTSPTQTVKAGSWYTLGSF
jgi:hypothetical protein